MNERLKSVLWIVGLVVGIFALILSGVGWSDTSKSTTKDTQNAKERAEYKKFVVSRIDRDFKTMNEYINEWNKTDDNNTAELALMNLGAVASLLESDLKEKAPKNIRGNDKYNEMMQNLRKGSEIYNKAQKLAHDGDFDGASNILEEGTKALEQARALADEL